MAEPGKITDVGSLEKAVLVAVSKFGEESDIWWRGHSVAEWDLVPKVYRLGRENDEHNFALTFLHSARSRYIRCPDSDDWSSWLFLMQHYGLPTRLLDWSKSALVGLYFSVCEPQFDDESGAVWALRPARLNKQQFGSESLVSPQSEFVKGLCNEAFISPQFKKAKVTVGVPTDQFDVRHLVQESTFTIHATNTPINNLAGCNEYLLRFEVPSAAKKSLRFILNRLGINSAYLFPDLDNLARHVSSMTFLKADT